MATASQLLNVLTRHIGKGNGIGVKALATQLGCEERRIRKLTTQLINDGVALCSHPSTGYYIAENPAEVVATCKYHRSRALHELHKESLLSKIPLTDLLGQLHLPT